MFDRRTLLAASGAVLAGACVPIDRGRTGRLSAKLRLIEAAVGGRLGAYLLDTRSGAAVAYRQDERFPHCSSFKTSLAALVLERVEAGAIDGDAVIRWSAADMVPYAPFVESRMAQGATAIELARAAQVLSDNVAANLLLARVGGPEAVTAFWRVLGDGESRLDRTEPQLNNVPPGELRDTATPRAMAHTLSRMLYGDALTASTRAALREWMAETRTGAKRVRAALPEGFAAGDKTGNSGNWPGMTPVAVDVGWAEPPGGGAYTFASYWRSAEGAGQDPNEVLRQVGEVLAEFASPA